MFLVITEYLKNIEDVEKYLPAHSAFLDKYYAQKKIIFSGRRNPRIGGAIMFNVDSEAEVQSILSEDPFKRNGIAKYELYEFIPTKYDERFSTFIR